MNIILNNNKHIVLENISISDLLKALNIKVEYMAVEVNASIVPKSEYDHFKLQENDKIEIISAVGGG